MEEALYVLGKNFLGKNVTDRLFPVAKTLAKGMGHIGDGLSTFGELLPPVEFDGSALTLLPSSIVVGEDEYNQQQKEAAEAAAASAANFDSRPRQGQQSAQQRLTTAPKCTTPNGGTGRCTDIQNCPILLADLGTLRKSVRYSIVTKKCAFCYQPLRNKDIFT